MKNDITGKRFGRLVVIEQCESKNNRRMWKCKCDCGKEKSILGYSLTHDLRSHAVALEMKKEKHQV